MDPWLRTYALRGEDDKCQMRPYWRRYNWNKMFFLFFIIFFAPGLRFRMLRLICISSFFWKIIFCLICHNQNYKFVYFYKTPIERFELFFFKCRTQIGFFKEHQLCEKYIFVSRGSFWGWDQAGTWTCIFLGSSN